MNKRNICLRLFVGGDTGVGKTSIINNYLQEKNKKSNSYNDYPLKEINFNGENIFLKIWEMPSNQIKNPSNIFNRGSDCFFLCFDLFNLKSFENLENWLEYILTSSPYLNIPLIILGNKMDLNNNINKYKNNNQLISNEKIEEWCKKQQDIMKNRNSDSYFNSIHYFEISAKESINIKESFEKGIELAFKLYNQSGRIDAAPIILEKQKERHHSERFCWCADVTDCKY
ncbi:hypothetical protein ACTFIV_008044 [Dictyostelium citrinum]